MREGRDGWSKGVREGGEGASLRERVRKVSNSCCLLFTLTQYPHVFAIGHKTAFKPDMTVTVAFNVSGPCTMVRATTMYDVYVWLEPPLCMMYMYG